MEALNFNGRGSEYFKIWIVNILLTILTMGIYYPWAKARNRRYFYANTTLADRNFEYHATGKQLFVGFLIGVIFFILYNILGQANPQLGMLLFFILLLILPWLIWRSLMFNMKVTSFSTVHFSFKGELGKAYMIFFGYPLLFLIILSILGLVASTIFPNIKNIDKDILVIVGSVAGLGSLFLYLFVFAFIKKKSTEYFIGNSYYGQGAFKTELETKKFFIILLKTVGISLLPLILISIALELIRTVTHSSIAYETTVNGFTSEAEIFFLLAYFVMIFIMILIFSYMATRERSYIYENTLLDSKIAFESTLRARDLTWVMVSNLFLILITLGIAFPWAKVRVAQLMLENTLVDTEIGFDNYISEKQKEVSAMGDQIGDAFDIDVGVAF